MAEKKSILEDAMLDIKKIQEALNANTKEILRSVAKEEIDSVVKESLMEKEYEEEDLEGDETGLEVGPEIGDDEELGLDGPSDDLEDIENSEEVGPEMGLDTGMDPEMGMDSSEFGGDEMDMTASSDDDVIAIYKKLSGEDEIEIVGDQIHMNVSEPGEYIINLKDGGSAGASADELGGELGGELELDGSEEFDSVSDSEFGGEEDAEDDGVDYEIEMGDEEEGESEESEEGESEESEEESAEEEEEELEENIGNVNGHAGAQGARRNGSSHLGFGKSSMDGEKVNENKKSKAVISEITNKYNNLLSEAKKIQTEAKSLRVENNEFRIALKEFRTKLVETVVFNSNLTYVVRILEENSTTQAEKKEIIRRFDEEVSNLIESKNLYKSISNGLASRKPIIESVENKIIKEGATSSSKQLNQNTAYVDPSTKRIIDLMKRVG